MHEALGRPLGKPTVIIVEMRVMAPSWLAKDLPGLAQKILHPGKPILPRQTRHLIYPSGDASFC